MSAANHINVPAGSDVEMLSGDGWVIMVTPPDASSMLSAMLTHDADVAWPDATGAALANEALAAGHPVMFQFATPRDAAICLARIMQGTAH